VFKSTPIQAQYVVFKKMANINQMSPAGLLVFQEVNPDSICRPCFGVYMNGGQATRFLHIPASHHNKSGVSSFGDGHVEAHRWLDSRTTKPGAIDYHSHDTASQGNRDIAWLKERTSRLAK
jgi:hypothetical protein